MNTTDFLAIAAAICPDRDAVLFDGKRYSYNDLNRRINRLSNAFRNLKIKKGDRISILQVNCPECIESYFASAKLGAIYVPLNFRAKEEELKYMLNNSETELLLVGKRYADMVISILPNLPALKKCICIDAQIGTMPYYEDLIDNSYDDETLVDIHDDDVTILMYTSGTTGRPKGVPLRHSGFTSYALENVTPASLESEERNLLSVPLYHIAGIQAMLASIYGGRTLVLMRQFEVNEWMRTVQKEQVTRALLVPTMLKNIIDSPHFAEHDLTSLQVITYGAAPMPFEVITKAISMLPWCKFINAFGQTETASTVTTLNAEDHIIVGNEEEKNKKLKRLASSIGRPLPDVEVKIIGESGETLPKNQIGDIVVRGSRIMTGYWQDDQRTQKAFTDDGWLITNDKGWFDEDGYIFLAGRSDDMIIRGGENISPEEIENAIYSHPAVEEVAVIGIPDAEWGQVPKAIVVLKKNSKVTAEEIIEHCHSHLASFKRPSSVVFTNELPRSAMGKLLKNKLREKYG